MVNVELFSTLSGIALRLVQWDPVADYDNDGL